jgi:hypothetical protein
MPYIDPEIIQHCLDTGRLYESVYNFTISKLKF